jgi:SAM-dependent methyltransferase
MHEHWDGAFTTKPDRFGSEPSVSAKVAAEAFARLPVPHPDVLDLGSGTGRDALFFARRGMQVVALDFSGVALDSLKRAARSAGLSRAIQTLRHDVREPLPFPDSTFDACYAHMLYCMDFALDELAAEIFSRFETT